MAAATASPIFSPPQFAAAARLLRAFLLVCLAGFVRAHDDPTELPKLLQSRVPLRDLAGAADSGQVLRFVVPPGATDLSVKLSRGTGDADLFLRRGAHPSLENFDFESTNTATNESIGVASPESGVWYVMIYGATAFQGARLDMRYKPLPTDAALPRILPGQGTFAGSARVRIAKSSFAGKIYYTTDGSEPTLASARYRRSLIFTQGTTLKTRTILKSGKASPVVEARIDVVPSTEPATLPLGDPVHHLAGNHGTMRCFKVTVPAGQSRLRVLTTGGTGNTSLFLRHGAPPTPRERDFRINRPRNTAQIDVANPAAGDWFIGVRGLSNYAGLSLLASTVIGEPDLIVWPERLGPYIVTEQFLEGDCEVEEGLVVPGERKLLRFTTETRNIGGANLVMGAPLGNPLFEFHDCHGHFHFNEFASYRLLDLEGNVAAVGFKVSFCLEDVMPWAIDAPHHARYDCSDQGIQAGWADIYDSGLPGQYIDITDVPPGDYLIEITVNPDRVLPESDFLNNTATVPFSIPGADL